MSYSTLETIFRLSLLPLNLPFWHKTRDAEQDFTDHTFGITGPMTDPVHDTKFMSTEEFIHIAKWWRSADGHHFETILRHTLNSLLGSYHYGNLPNDKYYPQRAPGTP